MWISWIIWHWMKLSFGGLRGSFESIFAASWGPSGAFWGLLRGLLEASWGPFGGLLGAPWGLFGGSAGGRFDFKYHFETLEISGRAVLKPSRDRFFSLDHFGVIFEGVLVTIVTANSTCKIDDLLLFWALWLDFPRFPDARKQCVLPSFRLLEAISTSYLQWNHKIGGKKTSSKTWL